LHATRLAARLARSNAVASVDRLGSEPAHSQRDLDLAFGLLAHSHRFVQSAMVLEAGLQPGPHRPAPASLQRFGDDVDFTLRALALTLRDPARRRHRLPDLRADQEALASAAGPGPDSKGSPREANDLSDGLTTETDRITESLLIMADLLRPMGHDAAPSSERESQGTPPL